MHDVACEFACAVGCAETISANVLKAQSSVGVISENGLRMFKPRRNLKVN